MFRRVLIANRGEIAVRVIRTLREMGIESIAVYSDADRDALFVQQADEAFYLGPAPAAESYLNIPAILETAREARADAIHPGYGFLAENAAFAREVRAADMTFIGPSSEAIDVMGDKVRARQAVQALGVPLVPGTPGPIVDVSEALDFGREYGYPLAVKASAGGGGRGIRVVESPDDMTDALEAAAREARTYFGNPEVYVERYFPNPRHVEVQVLGDARGTVVHLGERDCSVQRRHQKLIEETPSPAVEASMRTRMGEAAIAAARSVSYQSAGTVEFLVTREGEFYFLEMNTRIQVEHPVTEEVSGVDLIREMICIAAGEPMSMDTSLLAPNGHAIEVRVNAEDVTNGFRPTPTVISTYRTPGGPGVRVDGGVYAGYVIPQFYDSLIAKLIVWAPNREGARRRMLRAIDEYDIQGPSTTLSFSRAVLESREFVLGEVGTTFVQDHLDALTQGLRAEPDGSGSPAVAWGEQREYQVEVNRKRFVVRLAERQAPVEATVTRKRATRSTGQHSATLVSPMHGTVIGLKKSQGEAVEEGETVLVIEAMKMENEVPAHRSGTVTSLSVAVGDTVETNQELLSIE